MKWGYEEGVVVGTVRVAGGTVFASPRWHRGEAISLGRAEIFSELGSLVSDFASANQPEIASRRHRRPLATTAPARFPRVSQVARYAALVTLSLCLLLSSPARAANNNGDTSVPEKSEWDLSLKTGVLSGSLIKTDPTAGKTTYVYGGIPFVIGYNNDLTHGLTLQVDISLVADLTNVQVTKTGFDLGLAIHLMGGSRRTIKEYGSIAVISRETSNFSLLLRTGFHKYTASSKATSISLSGSVFDTMIGAEYRFDYSDRTSIALDLYNTFLSLSASLDGITSAQMMFLINLRFYL